MICRAPHGSTAQIIKVFGVFQKIRARRERALWRYKQVYYEPVTGN